MAKLPTSAIEPGPQARTKARIGKYYLRAEIGQGDRIKVYRAYDWDLGRMVTLKVLTDVADPVIRTRFRDEVGAIAGSRSEYLVGVYELGEHVGLPFAAMQALSDCDLGHAFQTKAQQPLLYKAMTMWQVAEGMRAAYFGGLAYLGIRPSAVAWEERRATVQDFGFVRLTPALEDQAGFYRSPEELIPGFSPDVVSDIFSFGVLYYEFLSGIYPFSSGNVIGHEAQSLRELSPDCPEELEQLVHHALDKRREFRYQNLDDLQDDAGPVLHALKLAHATALLEEVRHLLDSHEFDQAQPVLREALQLDPDNREGWRLRGDLVSHLRAHSARLRVEALLAEAGEMAKLRQFSRAVELLQSTVELDDRDPELKDRLAAMRSRCDAAQLCEGLTAEARSLLEQGNLSEALNQASEALTADAENAETAELLRRIGETIEQRKTEARISEGVKSAKSFLMLQAFDEAIGVLTRLDAECPDSSVVEYWLDHVRTQQSAAARQERVQAKLRGIRTLFAQQRYNGAIDQLSELSSEFPDEPQILELLDQARLQRDRESEVLDVLVKCNEHRGAQRFDEALQVIDSALQKYPRDATLTALRREIHEQRQYVKSAAEAQKALEEVQWLLDQNRPDLACGFLRQKAVELPGRPEIASRLEEIEKILQEWEKSRFVEEILGRVAELEHLQECSVALTVLEEALDSHPAIPALLERAERLRISLSDQERRKKLARRLDAVGQKMATQSWPQALTIIEAALAEFPGEGELQLLRQTAEEGYRRTEAENIIAEVRRCMADDEPMQAQQALLKGLELLPANAALQALQREVEEDRSFREKWRAAQILFGRNQFPEAEEILVGLTSHRRPEVEVLLQKVREARAAHERNEFSVRGREQAAKLLQEQQFDQAADLLRNLLALFPGDPILLRQLDSATGRDAGDPLPAASNPSPDQASSADTARTRRVAGTGGLFASAKTAVWKSVRNRVRTVTPLRIPLEDPVSTPAQNEPGASPEVISLLDAPSPTDTPENVDSHAPNARSAAR